MGPNIGVLVGQFLRKGDVQRERKHLSVAEPLGDVQFDGTVSAAGGDVHVLNIISVQKGSVGSFLGSYSREVLPVERFKKSSHQGQTLCEGRERGVHPKQHAAAQAGGGGRDPQPLVAALFHRGLLLHAQHLVGVLKALGGLGGEAPAGELLLELFQESCVFHKHSPFSCK